MVLRHGKAGIQQRLALLQTDCHIDQHFCIPCLCRRNNRKLEAFPFTGRYTREVGLPLCHRTSVYQHGSLQVIVVEVAEGVFVVDLHFLSGSSLHGSHPDGLVDTLHLVGVRIPRTVGSDESVVAEVLVELAVVVVPVARIAIEGLSVTAHQHRLVDKVPDETTLILGVFPYQVPVLLESSLRVAHRVCILTLNQRTGVVALRIAFTPFVSHIHRAEDIGIFIQTGTLVHDGARRVLGFCPTVACLEVRTEAGFITHRPDDDRRMVEVALHVALVALQVCQLVVLPLCQRLLVIAHAV